MRRAAELGEFLQSRRARLRPEDVGLLSYGERRRVPGLRREELAQIAGVSVSYYTRMEQGQSPNASDEVLAAVARALRLDDDERSHLRNLARPARTARGTRRPEQLRPGMRRLVDAMDGVPTVVLGRWTDVLGWNRLGHALIAGHVDPSSVTRPADRPNMTRLLFLDPDTRQLYVDWRRKARSGVAHLRAVAGRYPDDPRLISLVGELSLKSPEFASLWAAHPVQSCEPVARELRHPLVGELTVEQEMLHPEDEPGQMVVTFAAAPGSPSEAALRRLANLTARAVPAGGAAFAAGA